MNKLCSKETCAICKRHIISLYSEIINLQSKMSYFFNRYTFIFVSIRVS